MIGRLLTRLRVKATLVFMAISSAIACLIILVRICDSVGCDPFVFYSAVWLIVVVGLLLVIAWHNT